MQTDATLKIGAAFLFLSFLLEALMAEGTMIDMGDGFGGMSLLSCGAGFVGVLFSAPTRWILPIQDIQTFR